MNMIEFSQNQNWLLLSLDIVIFVLEIWMIIESVMALNKHKSDKLGSTAKA